MYVAQLQSVDCLTLTAYDMMRQGIFVSMYICLDINRIYKYTRPYKSLHNRANMFICSHAATGVLYSPLDKITGIV